MDENPNISRYSKEQKIGLVLLSSFVILAVTLGLIQMRNTVYRPFALNNSIPPFLGDEVNTPDALRYRDTDFDGLTDFDELYIYTTSPYLADSDSDGITDKDEIAQGKNPNCAEGKDCGADPIQAGSMPVNTSTVTPYSADDPQSLEDFMNNPDNLRAALLSTGMSPDLVKRISDEELLIMAKDTLTATSSAVFASSTQSPTTTAQVINNIMGVKTQ